MNGCEGMLCILCVDSDFDALAVARLDASVTKPGVTLQNVVIKAKLLPASDALQGQLSWLAPDHDPLVNISQGIWS